MTDDGKRYLRSQAARGWTQILL